MKSAKKKTKLELLYPTKGVWDLADKAVDELPFTETMQKHIAVWEAAYFAAGGKSSTVNRYAI